MALIQITDSISTESSEIAASATAVKSVADMISSNSGAKIVYGSYSGLGTYGASYPNSIGYSFTPKIIIIGSSNEVPMICQYGQPIGVSIQNGVYQYIYSNTLTWYSSYLSWYCSSGYRINSSSAGADAGGQLNASGITYYYTIIG